jgi:hypothetical protein
VIKTESRHVAFGQEFFSRLLGVFFEDRAQLEDYLARHSTSQVRRLQDRLKELEQNHAKQEQERNRLFGVWRSGLELGLIESALEPALNDLNAAAARLDESKRTLTETNAQLLRISAGLVVNRETIQQVVERVRHALWLADGEGEPTTDLRTVLWHVLEPIIVTESGGLKIRLKGADGLLGALSSIAERELALDRTEREVLTALGA